MPGPPEAEDVGRLYDRLGAQLYRYALMILGDSAAAEDVVHDVFAVIIRRPPQGVERIDHYLRMAVRNACYSRVRSKASDPVSHGTEALLFEPAAPRDSGDERMLLERALRSLPADQREVVYLKVYEGRTFREIADINGDSINTVAGRYRYAMEKLRARIEPGR